MKKKILGIMFILALFTVLIPIGASAEEYGVLTIDVTTRRYTEGDTERLVDEACVTKCDKNASGNLTIPSQITVDNVSYDVTWIRASAFKDCTALENINIPPSVTLIDYNAFEGCSSLKNVNKSENTEIYTSAFKDCTSLESIELSNNITYIDNYFSGCTGLKTIIVPYDISYNMFSDLENLSTIVIGKDVASIRDGSLTGIKGLKNIVVDENNANYASVDGVLCNKDRTELISYPVGRTDEEYTIPEGIEKVCNYAFNDIRYLKSLIVPKGVSVADYALLNAPSLRALTCDSVRLASAVCKSNSNMTDITLLEGVTSINIGAFEACNNLKKITLPDTLLVINNNAFSGCTGLTEINIPDNVTYIGDYAFWECAGLSSIRIPNTVTSIREGAFADCTNLKTVKIPKNVTTLGETVFANCTNLTKATILCPIQSVPDSAFLDCINLQIVNLPSSIYHIEPSAFENCEALTDIYFSGSENEWKRISVEENNDVLNNATVHYNSNLIAPPKITEKKVTEQDGAYTFEVQLEDVEDDFKLITVLYDTEQISGMNSADIAEGDTVKSVDVTADTADKAKIFIWDSLSGMRPLCEAVTVDETEFVTE